MLNIYKEPFVHITWKQNILADIISSLKMLNIYKEPSENPQAQIVSDSQSVVAEIACTL